MITTAIKLKTSPGPARLAQLLQRSLAFCCKLQPVTAVNGCNLQQNANEGCNSCVSLVGLDLSFIAAACYSCNNFRFCHKFYCSCDPSISYAVINTLELAVSKQELRHILLPAQLAYAAVCQGLHKSQWSADCR